LQPSETVSAPLAARDPRDSRWLVASAQLLVLFLVVGLWE
jgi:hypothetical protein